MRIGFAVVVLALSFGTSVAWGSTPSQRFFFTPEPNGASCEIDLRVPGVPTAVRCVIGPPQLPADKAIGVTLTPTGALKPCRGLRCVGNAPIRTPTLRYGQTVSLGPFECSASRADVRCTVTRLRHGFLLSRTGLKRL